MSSQCVLGLAWLVQIVQHGVQNVSYNAPCLDILFPSALLSSQRESIYLSTAINKSGLVLRQSGHGARSYDFIDIFTFTLVQMFKSWIPAVASSKQRKIQDSESYNAKQVFIGSEEHIYKIISTIFTKLVFCWCCPHTPFSPQETQCPGGKPVFGDRTQDTRVRTGAA